MLLKWLKKIPKSEVKEANESHEVEAEQSTTVLTAADESNETTGNEENEVEQEDAETTGQKESDQKPTKLTPNQLELVFPSRQTIRHLVLLNSMALPLNYGDERAPHYQFVLRNQLASEEFVNDPQEHLFWTKMAYYRNALVGAITLCRRPIDRTTSGQEVPIFNAIILTLAVLPTFRRRGVASILMEQAIQQCQQWGNVQQILLHCQAANETARAFYRQLNFVETKLIPNYYASWRIAEPDACQLELVLSRKN